METDSNGIVPEKLEEILFNWDASTKKPRVIYTVPNGGNPTGYSSSVDRKAKIYEIAKKYDLIILEDDPYYYLQVSLFLNATEISSARQGFLVISQWTTMAECCDLILFPKFFRLASELDGLLDIKIL